MRDSRQPGGGAFSHDARPEQSASLGCQRESYDDQGFGLALGLSFGPEGRVVLVDPGYEAWSVEAADDDRAVGLWSRLADPAAYFREHLALDNVEVLTARS